MIYMKIFMKKTLTLLLAAIVVFSQANALGKKSEKKTVSEKTAAEVVADMKTGWNLGNTFDANGSDGLASETSWGQPYTTKEMIDGIAAAGFKTIRIPVSWANHLDSKNYKIDPAWMKRVKQVVDWAIEDGLYVILNCHHDNYTSPSGISYGDGYYPNPVSWNESMRFIKNIWKQISATFNNEYDEHLIFEVMNEPRLRGHEHEWWASQGCNDCKYGAQTLNKLNQLALDTIRASKGNNATRLVMIPGLAAAPHSVIDLQTFKMPSDTAENRLILSVHIYSPYSFAMQAPGETEFMEKHRKELSATFSDLNESFAAKGIPVVIGEYGATNKNNDSDREAWFRFFVSETHKYGMCCCLWDNGDSNAANTFEEKFGFYNRTKQEWFFPGIIQAIMESAE